MDKIKSFVIKYQMWIKLAIIALLICSVFTPIIHIHIGNLSSVNCSLFDLIAKTSNVPLESDPNIFLFICSWIAFIGIIAIIVLLLLNLHFRRATLDFYCTVIYILVFALTLFVTIYSLVIFTPFLKNSMNINKTWGIPHIAFYLLCLLFIFNAVVLYFMKKLKMANQQQPDSDRIAELESRIEKLESQNTKKNGE